MWETINSFDTPVPGNERWVRGWLEDPALAHTSIYGEIKADETAAPEDIGRP